MLVIKVTDFISEVGSTILILLVNFG